VIYEAARAICQLPDVTARELTPAITGATSVTRTLVRSLWCVGCDLRRAFVRVRPVVLQLFLSSPKATMRFAAVRTLVRCINIAL
jgi:hypothetical protein